MRNRIWGGISQEARLCVPEPRYPFKNGVHIPATGMNTGIVNMWARHGIEKFGVQLKIIIFEHDSSQTASRDCPVATWSVNGFRERSRGNRPL